MQVSGCARFTYAYSYPRYYYAAGFICACLKTDCGLFRGEIDGQ